MKVLTIIITHANRHRHHMRFVRSLYNWTMELASNPRAIWLLGFVSFIEAIFFPIPPDVLLIPMILANVKKAWFYACVATTMSVLGGLFGYAIGFLAYAQIAEPLLITLGKQSAMDLFSNSINENGFLIVLTAGISQIPFKVVAKYRNNDIKPLLFPHTIEQVAKGYNHAHVLVETNDLDFDSKYQIVNGAAHSNSKMSKSAAKIIL